MTGIETLAPILVYLVTMVVITIFANRRLRSCPCFKTEYFLGGRSFGGIVLALSLSATFVEGSSFVSGPGVASRFGYGWVFLAMIQVPTAVVVLGILGKKFAIVARRIQAVTILDVLRVRYENKAVVVLSALALVVFLICGMVVQWSAGARLLESMGGIPYVWGVILFSVTVVTYVTFGGFRAVVASDIVQMVIMCVGAIVFFVAVVIAGGGVNELTSKLSQIDVGLIKPTGPSSGSPIVSVVWVCSFWVLVGFGLLGVPPIAMRAMVYRNAKAMKRAMIWGPLLIGFLVFSLHIVGAWGRVLVPGIMEGHVASDMVIPELAKRVLPFWLATVLVLAPLAAIMSTVDSILIVVTATLIKDVYINYVRPVSDNLKMRRLSVGVTGLLVVIVTAFSLRPPDLIAMVNLFALGGMEAAFVWPMVLGLFWQRANAQGALASIAVGLTAYGVCTLATMFPTGLLQWFLPPFGVHPVIVAVGLSLLAMIGGSLAGRPPKTNVIQLFWGKYPLKSQSSSVVGDV